MRTALTVVAAVLGAAIGAVVGIVVSFLLWLVFVEGGGPEAPIGALVRIVFIALPTGLVAGGMIGWELSRKSRT